MTSVPFRLGIIATLCPFLGPDLLSALTCDSSGLTVHLTEGQTDGLLAALRSGAQDAIMLATEPEGDDLVALDLFDEPLLLAEAPGKETTEVPPGTLLLPEEGNCLRAQGIALCGTAAVAEGIRTGNLLTLIGLASSGLGTVLIPALAAPWARSLVLRTMPGARRRVRLVARRGCGRRDVLVRVASAARAIAALPPIEHALSTSA
jgi:LysR family transcriptional regulator, hydrogen peroxide-inducible genes activator